MSKDIDITIDAATQDAGSTDAGVARADATAGYKPLPADAIAIVPLRNMLLFPGIVAPVTFGRESSVAAAQDSVKAERRIGFLLQRDATQDRPAGEDLYWVGTSGQILRYITGTEGAHHMVVQGQERFRVLEFLEGWPFLVARIAVAETVGEEANPDIEARFHQLKQRATEALGLLPQAPDELANVVQGMTSAAALSDLVVNFMDIKVEEKQALLECFDLRERLDRVLRILGERVEVLRISARIGEETKKAFDERQREHVLREQMRQIQKELGESDDSAAEIEELKKAVDAAGMPEDTAKYVKKELRRLERMSDSSGEGSMLRTWLEWMTELPWKTEDAGVANSAVDIAEARRVLDADHYGLDKIKRRILEWLSVRKLAPEGKSPILCFVGPPGVGKTSLGMSIARATGRKFQRVALGGVHDEAEIRGHRRTYIGAMPGNVIQALKRAQSRNAVFMLDEIDKVGAGGFHGDPASALLEVLDPEQNSKFRDNYLGVDFDLSKVLFIATANVLDTIPGPLRDRMEIIQLPGYTEAEKLEIARRYLVSRQLKANGLKPEQASVTDAALRRHHRGLHARGRRAQPRARDRQRAAACGDANRRGRVDARGYRRAGPACDPRREALRERDRAACRHAGRGHGPGLDAGGRGHTFHRGDEGARIGQADPHRTTGRGDEGIGAGRAHAGKDADRGVPGQIRHPRARPCRRNAQGRAERGGGDVPRAGVAAHGPAGEERSRDDRRNLAARPRAAHRRGQGKGARGPARWHPYRAAAEEERKGPRRRAGRRARPTGVRVPRPRGRRGAARDRGTAGAAEGGVNLAHLVRLL